MDRIEDGTVPTAADPSHTSVHSLSRYLLTPYLVPGDLLEITNTDMTLVQGEGQTSKK